MIINLILFLVVFIAIILLYRQIKIVDIEKEKKFTVCKFYISNPIYEINNSTKIAKFKVYSKNKNIYFQDFPIAFKFYSNDKFCSRIKITYNVTYDDEIEIIYDKIVEFTENVIEHIYYINDIIVGSIDIEIQVDSFYGKPTILFEILQNNLCFLDKEYKLEIIFPD